MRTTINIDTPILEELKKIQAEEGKPLGRLVSELLLIALDERSKVKHPDDEGFRWNSKPMKARVDIADREAVYDAMEGDEGR